MSGLMAGALLTPAAQRHISRMLRAVRPSVRQLERQFRSLLEKNPYDAEQLRALLEITPASAARARSLSRFLKLAETSGRKLARLNLPLAETEERLAEAGKILGGVLGDKFQPAREQLQLATVLMLREAYYQVREAEAQAFFELSSAQLESAVPDQLLRRFVRILTRALQARAGRLVVRPVSGKLSRPLCIARGDRREALIADEAMRGRYLSYWSYPLPPVGIIQFGFSSARPILPRELGLLEWARGRCQEAMERARLQSDLRRSEAQSREAEEQERRRIGRELHDETGQTLLLLRLQLELMEREVAPEFRERVAESREVVEWTVTELRRIIAALSPTVLDRLGLQRALHQLVARFQKMHRAKVALRMNKVCASLPASVQEVVYRVAQESLQNIARHTNAAHVNLSLRAADGSIRLGVSDDGAGFCTDVADRNELSFGLAGMRQRAALLGGTLELRSAPGKGTSIVLQLPNSNPEAPHGKNSSNSH